MSESFGVADFPAILKKWQESNGYLVGGWIYLFRLAKSRGLWSGEVFWGLVGPQKRGVEWRTGAYLRNNKLVFKKIFGWERECF